MSILDGCLNDELRVTGSVDNFNYYIAQTGLTTISAPEYTQTLLNCPITWTLVMVD